MKWILFIWLFGAYSGSLDHVEFKTREECEYALNAVKVKSNGLLAPAIGGVCVEVSDDRLG
ncbi:MAG: hypothetical protein DRQ48_00980 [Gammaproteobacteria bacterium]|nr:MAG: hypothetical protein DRQ44_00390 [Gammaproteobacteria bacterium]RKZ72253.1 MAG: hypothetical protein DRQ48_00980 [Gammaproteobacteria bacterium]